MAKFLVYLSRVITGNVISAKTVMESMVKYRRKVSARTTAALLPFWTAETPFPDFEALILAMAGYLKKTTETMSRAERVHAREVIEGRKSRTVRDRVVPEVLAEITKMRSAMKGVFDEADIAALGIYRPLGDQPMEVLRQCELVVESLDETDALEPIIKDIDPGFVVATTRGFREKVTELRSLLDALGGQNRDAEATLLTKQDEIDEYSRIFLYVARIWESMLRINDFPEEAKRVRPSPQRPGRTDVEPDDDGDEPPELPEVPEATVKEPAAPESSVSESAAPESAP